MGPRRLFEKALALCLLLSAGCAGIQTGKPVREGVLPDGARYQDFSRQPYGYLRVTTGPDGRKDVRDLHTEQNFENLKSGMTAAQVEDVVGVLSFGKARYGDGRESWTYRYYDLGIAKVLYITFGPDGRMLRYDYEWDPNVYSKKSGRR